MNELLPCPFCGGPVDVEKTHIDTLEQTAAERVIADGSRGPTPDYTGEGSAWVPPAESHSIGTADSVYFRRELESLAQRLPSADGPWLARYLLKLARVADSATVDCAPVEVRAAVGPELTLHDVIDTVGCDDSKPWEIITSELNKKLHSRSRAIPADRVPGDGMVAVGREEFEGATRWTFEGIDVHKIEHKKGFWFAVRRENSCMSRAGKWDLEPLPSSRTPEFFAEFRFDTFRDALIALRANQGGAAA